MFKLSTIGRGAVRLAQSVAYKETPESKARVSICEQCNEHFNRKTRTCNLCGCFVDRKALIPTQHCDINKW